MERSGSVAQRQGSGHVRNGGANGWEEEGRKRGETNQLLQIGSVKVTAENKTEAKRLAMKRGN